MEEKKFTEKLKKYLKERGLTQKNVADILKINPSSVNNLIKGRDQFGAKTAAAWSTALGIDALWLVTQGEQGVAPTTSMTASIAQSTDIINIPILNLDVRGGLLPNAEADVEEYTIDTMPFSRKIATEGDVVVPVYGDSMSPRYPSGSHILIRPLPMWREWLELGQSYVLELSDWRRTIKIVRKGATNDTYRLECYNVDYDTTEIPKNLIEHIWQVLMCVKREVM